MRTRRLTDNPRIHIDEEVLRITREQKISRLIFFTERGEGSCPLACSYCFLAKQGENRVMPLEVMFDAIDWLREVAVEKPSIYFFGTEPTKQWNHIVMARTYAPDLEIGLTTNGYLLNEERIRWLAENDIRIYVYSIDGGPEHNRHRLTRSGKPSWERVAENLKLLLKTELGQYVTARGTWMPDDYDLVSRYKALEELGARSIVFIPSIEADWDEEKVARAYIELADYYKGGKSPSNMIEEAIQRIIQGADSPPGNGCNTGRFAWAVSVDGKLTLCQAYEEHDYGVIGSIYEGITNLKAFEITWAVDDFHTLRNPYPKEQCRTCHAYNHCMGAGFCAEINHEATGNPAVPPDGYCNHLRGMVTGLKYWASLRLKNDPDSVINNIGKKWEIVANESEETSPV